MRCAYASDAFQFATAGKVALLMFSNHRIAATFSTTWKLPVEQLYCIHNLSRIYHLQARATLKTN
jgi:hypothetical protein